MTKQLMKKAAMGLVMALSLSFFTGILLTPTVQAQGRAYPWWRQRDNRRDNDRNRDWQRRQQQRDRNWSSYRYGTPRNYPSYGNYGSYGRYNNAEVQRGFYNGRKEGLDDARDHDSFNPNRHSSFRDGNPAYRQGFHRGYEQGYRQYANYGWR